MRKKFLLLFSLFFLFTVCIESSVAANTSLTKAEQKKIIERLTDEEKILCGYFEPDGFHLLDEIISGEKTYTQVIEENKGYSIQSMSVNGMIFKGASRAAVGTISKTFGIGGGLIKNAHTTCKYKIGSTYYYCLDPSRHDPPGTSYTRKNLSDFSSKHTSMNKKQRIGLTTLMVEGYPVNKNFKSKFGLTDTQAVYTTQNAIRRYMYDTGMYDSYAKSAYKENNHSKGNAKVWKAYNHLVDTGKAAYKKGAYPSSKASMNISPAKLKWTYDKKTNKLKSSTQKITINNAEDGYVLSKFPSSITCQKTSGTVVKSNSTKLTNGSKVNYYASLGTDVNKIKVNYYLKYPKYTYSDANYLKPASSSYQPMLEASIKKEFEQKKDDTSGTIKTGSITLLKVDKKDNTPISKVKFKLLDADGSVIKVTGSNGAYEVGGSTTELYTGTNGKIKVTGLPEGTWYLQETEATGTYLLDTTKQSFNITSSNFNPMKTMTNISTLVTILKTDGKSGEMLQGAKFQLKKNNVVIRLKKDDKNKEIYTYKTGGSYSEITTDINGKAVIKGLPLGTYTITETKAPTDYVKNPDYLSNTFTLSDDVLEVAFDDKDKEIFKNYKTSLTLHKKDLKTGELIDGAVFNIFDSQGKVVGFSKVKNGEYKEGGSTTGLYTQNGILTVKAIDFGKYTVKEISAPEKYLIDEQNEKDFEINTNNLDEDIEFENLLTSLTIEKYDKSTDELLDGAKFNVFNSKGELMSFTDKGRGIYYTKGKETSITTLGGKLTIYALPKDTYTVKEVSSPKYFKLDSTDIREETIDESNNEVTVKFENEPILTTFIKKDSKTKENIDTVTINIYDKETNKKLSFVEKSKGNYEYRTGGNVSDLVSVDGEIKVKFLDENKTYYAVEVTSPLSFININKNEKIIFSPKSTEDIEVNIENDPTGLKLHKSNGHTGKGLKDVSFNIVDKTGTKVKFYKDENDIYYPEYFKSESINGNDNDLSDTVITNKNGDILIHYLRKGDYTLKEVKAPEGFVLMDDTKVTIGETDSIEYPAIYSLYNYHSYGTIRVEHRFDDELSKIPEVEFEGNRYVETQDYKYLGNIIMESNGQGVGWQKGRLSDEYLKAVDDYLKSTNSELALFGKGTLHFDHVEIMTDYDNLSDKTKFSVNKPGNLISKHHYPLDGTERVYNSTDDTVSGKFSDDMTTIVFYYKYDVAVKNNKKPKEGTPEYEEYEKRDKEIETNNPKTEVIDNVKHKKK